MDIRLLDITVQEVSHNRSGKSAVEIDLALSPELANVKSATIVIVERILDGRGPILAILPEVVSHLNSTMPLELFQGQNRRRQGPDSECECPQCPEFRKGLNAKSHQVFHLG